MDDQQTARLRDVLTTLWVSHGFIGEQHDEALTGLVNFVSDAIERGGLPPQRHDLQPIEDTSLALTVGSVIGVLASKGVDVYPVLIDGSYTARVRIYHGNFVRRENERVFITVSTAT